MASPALALGAAVIWAIAPIYYRGFLSKFEFLDFNLLRMSSVAEAAVVPAPDPVRGAVVKAFVVLREGHTPSQELADELATFVAKETGPYKHPRKIEFVTSLEPVKTISGKIRRKSLRLAEYGRAERSILGAEFDVKPLRGG